MTTEYITILDFFIHVKSMKLCTTPYCTTCGAKEYRNLCKQIGDQKLKRLAETTSDEDLNKVRPEIWYEPLKLLLIDGYHFDNQCPLMQRYNKGYEYLIWGPNQKELLKIGNTVIYAEVGSIFEQKDVDIVVLFENPGLAELPFRIKEFISRNQYSNKTEYLIPTEGKHGMAKCIYRSITSDTDGIVKKVETKLFKMLDIVNDADYASVAMNGIKTKGHSEIDNVNIIIKWLKQHSNAKIKKIVLVDKRAGFNNLNEKCFINNERIRGTHTTQKR